MLEERLTAFWTLQQRYRKATNDITRKTIVRELKELHNTTGSATLRLKVSGFLSSIGAWEQAS